MLKPVFLYRKKETDFLQVTGLLSPKGPLKLKDIGCLIEQISFVGVHLQYLTRSET